MHSHHRTSGRHLACMSLVSAMPGPFTSLALNRHRRTAQAYILPGGCSAIVMPRLKPHGNVCQTMISFRCCYKYVDCASGTVSMTAALLPNTKPVPSSYNVFGY